MRKSSTPIRRTLMNMILLASGVVLLVTSAAFCAYEFLTFRQSSIQQLQILSRAIASNSILHALHRCGLISAEDDEATIARKQKEKEEKVRFIYSAL